MSRVPHHLAVSLEGQVAIVTGGGGGIGTAVAAQLLDAGARVISFDRANRPGPPGTESMPCDMANGAEVTAALAQVALSAGRLDIVVHCAGITRDRSLARMTDLEWSEVIATNLGSAFHLVRAAIAPLREAGGGAIVLVASINAERGKAGQANYTASKAGLIGLAKTAARELGRHGIRVNVVAPGWIDSAMTAALGPEFRQRALDETVLGRVGTPGDVAGPVLFLCSPLSRHITGQVLRVDGGQLIS
jgi:NAD(P)-dependent dehydrogenase (short-subunit alcohol dehydrogenase family)